MKIIIAILSTIIGSTALTQTNALRVSISSQEAQSIIDGIEWIELGTRFHFPLSQANAECMTLNNYDDEVGFDCLLSNSTHEVVLSRRDLEHIIDITNRKLSASGLTLRSARAEMHCFQNGDCHLTNTLSLSEEKHRYCFMTSHSQYGGKRIEETTRQENILVESVDCQTQQSFDYLGNLHTIVEVELKTKGDGGSTLGVDLFHSWGSVPGHVDNHVACETIHRTFGRGPTELLATVERELAQTEITSIRNSDKSLFERVNLTFPNGVAMHGAKTELISQGSFCADFQREI